VPEAAFFLVGDRALPDLCSATEVLFVEESRLPLLVVSLPPPPLLLLLLLLLFVVVLVPFLFFALVFFFSDFVSVCFGVGPCDFFALGVVAFGVGFRVGDLDDNLVGDCIPLAVAVDFRFGDEADGADADDLDALGSCTFRTCFFWRLVLAARRVGLGLGLLVLLLLLLLPLLVLVLFLLLLLLLFSRRVGLWLAGRVGL
jgi:hypothetical protein